MNKSLSFILLCMIAFLCSCNDNAPVTVSSLDAALPALADQMIGKSMDEATQILKNEGFEVYDDGVCTFQSRTDVPMQKDNLYRVHIWPDTARGSEAKVRAVAVWFTYKFQNFPFNKAADTYRLWNKHVCSTNSNNWWFGTATDPYESSSLDAVYMDGDWMDVALDSLKSRKGDNFLDIVHSGQNYIDRISDNAELKNCVVQSSNHIYDDATLESGLLKTTQWSAHLHDLQQDAFPYSGIYYSAERYESGLFRHTLDELDQRGYAWHMD